MSGESWVEEKDRILYISSTKAIFSSWSALTKSAPAITISSTFTFPSKLCLRSSTLAKRLRVGSQELWVPQRLELELLAVDW